MLSNIRENSSGVLAWIVAILIIIAMAFFGLSSYVSQEPVPVVAEVGDRSINQYEFRNEFSAWQQQMRQRLGQNQTLDLNSDSFKQSTLERMVNREIVAELVDKQGYTVSDVEVAKEIRNSPQFQTDGVFDKEIYDRFVASRSRSITDYENQLRASIASRQVVSGFGESSFALENTVSELAGLQAQKRNFDLVSYKISDLEKDVELTEEQIKKYYDDNIDSYQEDERVTVEYVRLSAKDLESEVSVTDEDLQLVYEDNKESYLSDETRNVRHILFTGDNSEADAISAVEKLKNGGDFAAMAKELSQDPGSAVKGGELGVVERGQMVKPFEESAFSLEQGVVSEPVQSRFGYHVIEVTAINSPAIPSFEEAKDDIRKEQVKVLSEEIFFDRLDQLKNIVYENPESLQTAADELNLKVEKTGLFSRAKGTGITNNPAIRDAAFSESVFSENNNSDVIELSPTDVVALRKDSFVEQKPKSLQQVRAQISKALKVVRAKTLVAEQSEELLSKLADADWNEVIKATEVESEEQTASYADISAGLDRNVLDQVFLATTADSEAKIGRVEGQNGDFYIYNLKSIDSAESVEKDITDGVERLVQAENSNSLIVKYLADQREKIGVKIDADAL